LGTVHNPAGILYTQGYKMGEIYERRWRSVIRGAGRVGVNEKTDNEEKNHRKE